MYRRVDFSLTLGNTAYNFTITRSEPDGTELLDGGVCGIDHFRLMSTVVLDEPFMLPNYSVDKTWAALSKDERKAIIAGVREKMRMMSDDLPLRN